MRNNLINGNANISEMTDRELRAYKRKLRRQREQRRKIVSIVLTAWLVLMCVVFYHSLTSSAKAGREDEVMYKYYTALIVKSGDSLWEIADNYIDYSKYKDKKAYIKEVCFINNLEDESEIRIGQRLVVPYYSPEFRH